MTNEAAIKYINKHFKARTKPEAVAILFASEDIIELDVLEWVKKPTSEMLQSFLDHSDDSCNEIIPNMMQSEHFFTTEEKLWYVADSMKKVMQTMQRYVEIHEQIKEKSK
tara:strand:+ start:701 stop:1030 length:330 start_codon:yes stop_codon:yes gene_type:complete